MNRPLATVSALAFVTACLAGPTTALADDAPPTKPLFSVSPVTDTAVIAVSTGFAGLLDLIMTTGEVRPQQISPTFQTEHLLGIDRVAVNQHVDPNARTFSNLGLGLALSYALIDPISTGVRERSAKTALADGVLYMETLAVTIALTNLAKVAVRRPRPQAYVLAQQHKNDIGYSNSDTDSSLSFFSGHTAATAAVTATATYLAFARSPNSARPWVTLLAGTALTTFVGFERVRAGQHFPTDVIAGAMAGAGVGILVPHLHRVDDGRSQTYSFGAAPIGDKRGVDGGLLTLTGVF